jgi:hypothetical protein
MYNFRLDWSDGTGESHLKIEWSCPSLTRQVIPQSYLRSIERVEGIPSIPGKSTVETFSTTSIAGEIYSMTMQS